MKPNLKKLEAEVARWNENIPVGSAVMYEEVIGDRDPKRYTTRTEAQILSGHTAVIWLNGKSGCVVLNHCTPVE